MPIQNIQGLVDKNGLSYIQSGNFINKYYNEGLANLGQRNTNDSILQNVTFTIKEVFNEIKNYVPQNEGIDPYLYVIYHNENPNSSDPGTFYTLDKDTIYQAFNIVNDNSLSITDFFDILECIQEQNNVDGLLNNTNGYVKQLFTDSEQAVLDNSYIILNKKLNVISELFDTIYDSTRISKYNLFIPVDYVFGYTANGINQSTIYNSFKDIYVNIIPEGFSSEDDDYELTNISFYTSNVFYCAAQSYIKTDVYDYSFNVDEDDNEEIICNYKFTLPYVNNNDYWVINGQETNIQAKAHDAINLNIILAYYYKTGDIVNYKFLSGINNNLDTSKIGSVEPQNAPRFNIQNGNDVITCLLQTPVIKEENLRKKDGLELHNILMNSTLVIVAKIVDIIDTNLTTLTNAEKYGDGFVTTLWRYNTNEDKFECICLDNNVALDFNQLTNFDNLLKYEIKNVRQIEPDNFLYTHVVFDQIYQQLKQETNKPIYSYPVLQNLKGSNYNNKYANNMNFSLKYINYISGEVGKDIKGVSKGSDTKYLKNNVSETDSNSVTNALYQYVSQNKINYFNEYIPNYNVPIFDMSEVLVKDSNVLNKYNIITVANNGQMYYSYIGTSHNTEKNVLTIGTSNLDINLGENTLTDYNTKKSFSKQNTLNIDFNKIYANGKVIVKNDLEVGGSIKIKNFEWTINKINGVELQSTTLVPQFKYYNFNQNPYKLLDISSLESNVKYMSTEAKNNKLEFGKLSSKDYLYIAPILVVPHSSENDMPYYYKYNDLLVLDNLVMYLGLYDSTNYSSLVDDFESNTNEIITIGGKKTYLVSSNNILSNSLSIISSTEIGVTIDISNIKNFYLGNTLYVTYIPSQKKLIVNEVQSTKIKSIWKIPTNIS